MFRNSFKKLDLSDIATILERVNPVFKNAEFDPLNTTILAIDLPFYRKYSFLEVTDHSTMPEKKRLVIYSDDKIEVIDYSNDPIYKTNLAAPIKLNDDNINEYVRFFFRACTR